LLKVKISFCLIKHYAMNLYGGSGVTAPPFFASSLGGNEWPANPGGNRTRHPLARKLGGPQSRCTHSLEYNTGTPARSPLYRPSYSDSTAIYFKSAMSIHLHVNGHEMSLYRTQDYIIIHQL
jgi:hypothetical protein